MRTFIQKLGKSLMAPLSMIVAAGLMLGLASLLTNQMIFGDALAGVPFIDALVRCVNALASALFSLLPVLFCMSLAMGMTREDKEVATFASVIAFVLFHTTINFFPFLLTFPDHLLNIGNTRNKVLNNLESIVIV